MLLSVVQGLTEFLPISSSGHLILASNVLDLPDQGRNIDIAVHVGTLAAVILYFWRDMLTLCLGAVSLILGRKNPRRRLIIQLTVATIPLVIAGFLVNRYFPGGLRNVEIIAWATGGFSILLWVADRLGMTVRRIEHISINNALFFGLFQVLALIPGTSRAGITMTAGRILGLERTEAARFSMLMSIPAILGAGILSGINLVKYGDTVITSAAIIAALLSFIAGISAIAVMMRWLRNSNFTPFVIYRIFLCGALLAWIYY